MARCLRCRAGNEWIVGKVPSEPADAVTRKVTIKVQDVIDYYGRNESEKARMKQVALSIIARCRIAYKIRTIDSQAKGK